MDILSVKYDITKIPNMPCFVGMFGTHERGTAVALLVAYWKRKGLGITPVPFDELGAMIDEDVGRRQAIEEAAELEAMEKVETEIKNVPFPKRLFKWLGKEERIASLKTRLVRENSKNAPYDPLFEEFNLPIRGNVTSQFQEMARDGLVIVKTNHLGTVIYPTEGLIAPVFEKFAR